MGTTSSAIFTGSSQFASDFQNVITRAVSIASQPITQLTSEKTTLTNESNEVTTLNTDFTALQTAVQGIDTAVNSSFSADISDPSVVSANLGSGAVEGNYAIQVNDIGAYSTMMTNTWNGPSGAAQTYQLYIGSQEYDVKGADNSAQSVAAAINSQYGSMVNATAVNVGSGSSPDYRIALESTALSSDAIDLQSGGASLAAFQNNGRPAQYEIDQSGNVVSSDSRNVTIANGITLTLLDTSQDPVNVTVTGSTSALSGALSSFVTAYNQAVTDVGSQRGQSGGPLQGQSLVTELASALGNIGAYTTSGAFTGLADLGLTLGDNGQLTFDSFQLDAADLSNSAGVTAFFGSATGSGFLKSATDALNSVEDPTTGLLPTAQNDFQSQITNLTNQISDKQTQVNDLQTQLQTQMSKADATIASMEQQYTYLSDVFAAEQTADNQMAGAGL